MFNKLIHEKKAFGTNDNQLPFYMNCNYRKISVNDIPPYFHYHSDIELIYCIRGELEVKISSNTIILKEDDLVYIGPDTPHSTTSHTDYNEHIYIKFKKNILHVPASRTIFSEEHYIPLLNDYRLLSADITKQNHLREIFISTYENFSHDDYCKRLCMRGNIMNIMSIILKNFETNLSNDNFSKLSRSIIPVFDYIDQNYNTITLEKAADFCNMSYNYFSKKFKSEIGISFTNFLIQKKVDKSVDFLLNTDLSLNEIALECGFSNLSHFIKCFNHEKGITPKKFRKIASIKQF